MAILKGSTKAMITDHLEHEGTRPLAQLQLPSRHPQGPKAERTEPEEPEANKQRPQEKLDQEGKAV